MQLFFIPWGKNKNDTYSIEFKPNFFFYRKNNIFLKEHNQNNSNKNRKINL